MASCIMILSREGGRLHLSAPVALPAGAEGSIALTLGKRPFAIGAKIFRSAACYSADIPVSSVGSRRSTPVALSGSGDIREIAMMLQAFKVADRPASRVAPWRWMRRLGFTNVIFAV